MESKKFLNRIKKALLYFFTACYIILGMLLHVQVSYLVVGKYPEITGNFVAREHSVEFSIAILVLIFIYFIYKAVRGKRRFTTFYYWFMYASILFFFYLGISLHQVEIIHLIQYAGVALLLSFCFDPTKKNFLIGTVLFWGTVLGILDEILQYYIVAPSHTYLDFNDFLVNNLGVVGGLLLYYGFSEQPMNKNYSKPFYSTKRFAFSVIIIFWLTVLALYGTLQIYPKYFIKPGSYAFVNHKFVIYMERIPGLLGSWQKHFVRGYYYTFTPFEGMLLITAICFLFSFFDPRFQHSVKTKILRLPRFFR